LFNDISRSYEDKKQNTYGDGDVDDESEYVQKTKVGDDLLEDEWIGRLKGG
jgi:hypothetical protein